MAEPALNTPDLDPGAGLDSGTDAADLSLHEELAQAFEAPEPTDEQRADGRPRDGLGRFAPADKAAQTRQEPAPGSRQGQGSVQPITRAPAGSQAAQAGGQGAPAPELKPPQSWTPGGRETWQAIPPAARAEIHRREGEMQHVLQEGAQQRQFLQAFEATVRPYEMFIRAENSSPLQAVANLMQTAAELRVGTPLSKANLVAGLIANFGIDVQMLDSIMAGKVPQPGQMPQAPMRDPRVDQILAHQMAQAQHAEAFQAQQLRQGLEEFSQGHEFYRDVAATMADIVEVRARQGQPIDLERIYQQACALDTGISTIQRQRAQSSQAGQRSQAVLRARRAAVSVRNEATPSGATLPSDDSIRASIEAAFERSEGI